MSTSPIGARNPWIKTEPDAEPLDFFRAVFRNPVLPLYTRMRAAEAAAQYTHPKLAAVITTDMSAQDFGDRLEAARKRVIEGIPPKSSDAPMVVPKASPRPGLPKKGKTHHWLATQRPQP